jgi:hypothetical protein
MYRSLTSCVCTEQTGAITFASTKPFTNGWVIDVTGLNLL